MGKENNNSGELADPREANALIDSYRQADNIVMKKYLSNLEEYAIIPLPHELKEKPVSSFVRLFKIEKVVYEKNEDILDKLISCYNALAGGGGSLVVIINSDGKSIDFYLGARADEISVAVCQSILEKALHGNFPGSELQIQRNKTIEKLIEELFRNEYQTNEKYIAAVSGIPGFRNSQSESEKPGYVQGIEKLADAMRGEKYSIIILAEQVSQQIIESIQLGYENLYSTLVPFASSELNMGINDSQAVTHSISKGFSNSINESLTMTQSHTSGTTETQGTTKTYSVSPIKRFFSSFIGGVNISDSRTSTGTENKSDTKSKAETKGETTEWHEDRQESDTYTAGRTRGLQIKTEDKSVKNLLEKIDDQLERLKESSELGMWNCSAYVIADDLKTTKIVSSTYKSLMRGENSSVEYAAVNIWNEKEKKLAVMDYLKKMHHPMISVGDKNASVRVMPTSLISGRELTIQAGLPHKSIPGLAVIEYASFGREVSAQYEAQKSICLGKTYHMGKEESFDVSLDLHGLASHTFITGSTGSGKSNAIHMLLKELKKHKITFLVIEPAKGEYKHVMGNLTGVYVFSTNPSVAPLLKINPFIFPDSIHVLEHIDRLVEIFNVCWPMYAAMPAVLKEAIEKAYESSGWDLDTSVNDYNKSLFPIFEDVLYELNQVITDSAYSEEVKSNYRGALFTRIRSLTNGLFGRIFSSDELDNGVLFDDNTIIDLSRIGSMETKSMIMGVLVMRLQEHRIAQGGMNLPLIHVTVLEEAHHILRKTSTEQVSESSNLTGKAVEMLANAIAEMRTYGEGFIIADQSPGLLDVSVIRNTNTKIILRLPDITDRELVGYAAGLNDEQVIELAKLQTGVAAIFQNGWLYPILCKIEKAKTSEKQYIYQNELNTRINCSDAKIEIIQYLLKDHLDKKIDYDIDALQEKVIDSTMTGRIKTSLLKQLKKDAPVGFNAAAELINEMMYNESAFKKAQEASDYGEWNREMQLCMDHEIGSMEPLFKNAVLQCLLAEKAKNENEAERFYFGWVDYMKEGIG